VADAGALRRELRPRGPVRFEMTVIDEPDAVRLRIRGELDVLTTPKLAAELNTVMRRFEGDVIVDLRESVFIDSAGLQILLGTQRRLGHASRKLTVVCDAGPVRRVIEMTRLDEALGLVWGDGA
jgi:anti-sigma B factor antagonist